MNRAERFRITVEDDFGRTLLWTGDKFIGLRELVRLAWCASVSRHQVTLMNGNRITASLIAPHQPQNIAAAMLAAFNGLGRVTSAPQEVFDAEATECLPDNKFFSENAKEPAPFKGADPMDVFTRLWPAPPWVPRENAWGKQSLR